MTRKPLYLFLSAAVLAMPAAAAAPPFTTAASVASYAGAIVPRTRTMSRATRVLPRGRSVPRSNAAITIRCRAIAAGS